MNSPRRERVSRKTRRRSIELRENATFPERLMWDALRARQLSGLKFRRQHPIDEFIVDFFCADAKLIIELDGESHEGRQEYDATRQDKLESHGFTVLRFGNDEVLENLDDVLEAITLVAKKQSG